jgi:diguanylate cyclase (GGDEF)-like protein
VSLAAEGALPPTKVGWLLPLLDERFDHNGCYLVPSADARLLVNVDHSTYASRNNGIGPHAWNRHWLLVPMYGRNGQMIGVLWADEPADRLLPPAWKLDALRLFADQAASAVVAAGERAQLTFLADHDPLTGLLNRRAFSRELARETARAERTGVPFGLILLDLIAFKVLNDTLGHVAGDAALCRVADSLRSELRADDAAFRLGGDEFAVVLGATTEEGGVELVARRLCARLASRIEGVSASFGHAVWSRGRTA